jgi:ribose/xylose/arabinose/galactoside ABC-type transport system permease subunit
MNNQPSLLHLLRYFGRDSATRVFGLFTVVMYVIFIPGMYLVDRYNYGRSLAYVGSAGETTVKINITVAVAWVAIIVYTLFKYRKYVRSSR